MPQFPRCIVDYLTGKDTAPVDRYEGFSAIGQIVLRDRRGALKAEVANVTDRSSTTFRP